jgi:hypothetical protein
MHKQIVYRIESGKGTVSSFEFKVQKEIREFRVQSLQLATTELVPLWALT